MIYRKKKNGKIKIWPYLKSLLTLNKDLIFNFWRSNTKAFLPHQKLNFYDPNQI